MNRVINIIDGTVLWYRGGAPYLFKYIGNLEDGEVYVVFDTGKSHKVKLYDNYKKKILTEEEKAKRNELFRNYEYYIALLDKLYPCFHFKGYEGDELIYNLIYVLSQNKRIRGKKVIVHTVDWDLLQLFIFPFVSIKMVSGMLIERDKVVKVIGKSWEEIILEKIMVGDKYDNIDGIVEKERFDELLNEPEKFVEVLSDKDNFEKFFRNVYLVMLGVDEVLIDYISAKLGSWKEDKEKFKELARDKAKFLLKLLKKKEVES